MWQRWLAEKGSHAAVPRGPATGAVAGDRDRYAPDVAGNHEEAALGETLALPFFTSRANDLVTTDRLMDEEMLLSYCADV